jgi:hypothetical protein
MLANETKTKDLNKIIIYGSHTADSYLIHINIKGGQQFKSCLLMR